MRTQTKVILAVLFLILCLLFVVVYTRGFLGKVIEWNTQQSQSEDFSRGLPELSPDELPQQGPLNTRNAIPEACNRVKADRDDVCGKFLAEYPSGCHWWHFSFISSCQERFNLCKKLQEDTLRECKIA
jgi:hypothetical protein